MRHKSVLALLLACSALSSQAALAGPSYDFSKQELEAILDDMVAWLPGEWSSYPQIYFENTLRVPAEGVHENWYRTFARIDAPQLGTHVFYGQINVGGRNGDVIPRSQVLYIANIDMKRQVVLIRGQSVSDLEKYTNLQDHPELWKEVRQRDPADIKCDFIWRRDGKQVVGVLDGPIEERRKHGPGTCSYMTANGQMEFVADAEWVLSPDELWLYDINLMAGNQFIGRHDKTHIRLYKASPYTCEIKDTVGARRLDAHDRGYTGTGRGAGGKDVEFLLVRAPLPAKDGFGLDDTLRLALRDGVGGPELAHTDAAPRASDIAIQGNGVSVGCRLETKFKPR